LTSYTIHIHRACVALILIVVLPVEAQVPLSEHAYRESGSTKGTVILQVNWGRYWGCGPYENAQLQGLTFRRLGENGEPLSDKDWELSPLSTLLVRPSFEPYVVLLEPGQYALSGYRFKVAASVHDVRVTEGDSSKLIVDGRPVGGSFNVGAGEVVYIGHFGVDCHGAPTPWRFYIDGKQDFSLYVDGFHKRFPFAKDVAVTYRLFQTEHFGQPYELPQ
jgi:hypothetical protein